MCRQASEATSPELLESPPTPTHTHPNIQTHRGVHLHILSRWLQSKPSQTAMGTFASRVEKPDPVTSRWPRPLRGKHEHLDSASKTNPDTAGGLCSTSPPSSSPCSNRLTRHDCPSTGHVLLLLWRTPLTSDCCSTATLMIHRLLQRMSEHLPAGSHMKDTRMRSAGGELNKKKSIWHMRVWFNS